MYKKKTVIQHLSKSYFDPLKYGKIKKLIDQIKKLSEFCSTSVTLCFIKGRRNILIFYDH
jgi:hypothetical protein